MVVASLVLHSYGVAYLIGGGPISGVQGIGHLFVYIYANW